MNDIKLLDFPGLARDFQQTYTQLKSERLILAQKVALRKHELQLDRMIESLTDNSEAGSDGVEEGVRDSLGAFDTSQVQLPHSVLQSCKQDARTIAVEAWVQKNMISQKLTWLPHQMLAYFGTWKAVKDDTGLYSGPLTWDANTRLREDYFALGSGLLATGARTLFFKDAPKGSQQYKSVINPLVPIILAGFKKFQGIKYSQWNPVGIEVLLDPELAKLVGVQVPDIAQSEIIALRNTALTDKTGPRMGIPNNPATCTKLNHLSDTAIGHLPKLAKYMVLQTWAAHPSNRNEYMILDPNDWDNIPEPLVSRDIFLHQTAKVAESKHPSWTDSENDVWL